LNYSFLKFLLGNSLRGFSGDATVIQMQRDMDFNGLSASLPPGIGSNGAEDTYKIASKILGSDKDNYDRSIDPDGTIELKTLINIYKIHTDGFLEYKYLPSQANTDKGNLEDAFKNAFAFVNGMKIFNDNENTTLYLSGYKEFGDSYQFKFDFITSSNSDDIPIYINYNYRNDTSETLNLGNAIVVTANSKNVLNCKALIKTFKPTGVFKQYGIGLPDATYLNGITLLTNDDKVEKDISISYEMDNEVENPDLKMVWVIKDGDIYYASPMINK
jgi:hypothetical protein